MDERVFVIGAGPAGVSAALFLAGKGYPVALVEQRDRAGGAIHRQPLASRAGRVSAAPRHARRWTALAARLAEASELVMPIFSAVFLGVDGHGRLLLDDRRQERVLAARPRAVILATGAQERVRPFPGWELPGVLSAGGAQVLLKETGRPLEGATLIAGNGPLSMALGAQMAAAGNPPVAVLERAVPWRAAGAIVQALASPAVVAEALAYRMILMRHGVPLSFGTTVLSARPEADGLVVAAERAGRRHLWTVRNLVVHDGISSPGVDLSAMQRHFPARLAGDAHEALGADAAIASGEAAAQEIAAILSGRFEGPLRPERLAKIRRFQSRLARIYAAPSPPVPGETVICRCENRRLVDLPAGASGREARLVGRFGMGVCQGRFCTRLVEQHVPAGSGAGTVSATRWPTRPVSVAAIASFGEFGNPAETP